MTRLTSINTFHQIEAEGLLSKMRWETYRILYEFGPMTASELLVKARSIHGMTSQRDNYQKRLGELRDSGVAYETQIRKCKITGRQVIEWDVTDQLPRKGKPIKGRPILYYCQICCRGGFAGLHGNHDNQEDQFCIGQIRKYREIR